MSCWGSGDKSAPWTKEASIIYTARTGSLLGPTPDAQTPKQVLETGARKKRLWSTYNVPGAVPNHLTGLTHGAVTIIRRDEPGFPNFTEEASMLQLIEFV